MKSETSVEDTKSLEERYALAWQRARNISGMAPPSLDELLVAAKEFGVHRGGTFADFVAFTEGGA